jgi:hypothetical protein
MGKGWNFEGLGSEEREVSTQGGKKDTVVSGQRDAPGVTVPGGQ